MKRKQYIPVILLISFTLLVTSCKKQDIPEYFAQTNVSFSYTTPDGATDSIHPVTVNVDCKAINHPEYKGSLEPYAKDSYWKLTMDQTGKIEHKYNFAIIDGLTAQYNQLVNVTRGDTVVFALSGKFQVNISADQTKVYLIDKVDTLIVP
ncbi:hypothetical protein PbJCM13498_17340 [Prolixibacter bellariivorans]|uniref:Uncharacterized protein n=1 Tax=Prolixibacter bellariivorans TaxID=314319 RepID=A0A5M4AZ15_9BACT|nr:hypothetical protein [Prolixibacter bellariivorans]GET32871.1 hypothetical protein PbJCM13498_17340 [Prolixibacter bellariivorans]